MPVKKCVVDDLMRNVDTYICDAVLVDVRVNFVIHDSVVSECNCDVEVVSGMVVCGESDWDLGRI